MCATEGTATSTVLIENDRVKATEWRFAKRGDNTGWHRHEYDYVIVPLFDGTLDIDMGGGEHELAKLHNGAPYFCQLGAEHDVFSENEFECAFIEVELLEPKAESAAP
jgi:quercetin dioxygenase-like cupin family protein